MKKLLFLLFFTCFGSAIVAMEQPLPNFFKGGVPLATPSYLKTPEVLKKFPFFEDLAFFEQETEIRIPAQPNTTLWGRIYSALRRKYRSAYCRWFIRGTNDLYDAESGINAFDKAQIAGKIDDAKIILQNSCPYTKRTLLHYSMLGPNQTVLKLVFAATTSKDVQFVLAQTSLLGKNTKPDIQKSIRRSMKFLINHGEAQLVFNNVLRHNPLLKEQQFLDACKDDKSILKKAIENGAMPDSDMVALNELRDFLKENYSKNESLQVLTAQRTTKNLAPILFQTYGQNFPTVLIPIIASYAYATDSTGYIEYNAICAKTRGNVLRAQAENW